MHSNMIFLYLSLFCFTVIKVNSLSTDTTANLIKQTDETSTLTPFELTTNDQAVANITVPKLDSTETTTQSVYIQNRAISNVTASGRSINGRAYTNSTSSSNSSSLSDGAVAGIVIGILALLCCCCLCGACAKKGGHWENAKVWVSD